MTDKKRRADALADARDNIQRIITALEQHEEGDDREAFQVTRAIHSLQHALFELTPLDET